MREQSIKVFKASMRLRKLRKDLSISHKTKWVRVVWCNIPTKHGPRHVYGKLQGEGYKFPRLMNENAWKELCLILSLYSL
jgi:hypothetical protein